MIMRRSGLSGAGLQRSAAPINQYGRIAKERSDRKKLWEIEHPPLISKSGHKHYYCHICLYFGEDPSIAFVLYKNYVLEHIIPKGRLTLDQSQEDSNLGPSHIKCNNEKGSKELWQIGKSPISGLENPYPTWTQYVEYMLSSGKS